MLSGSFADSPEYRGSANPYAAAGLLITSMAPGQPMVQLVTRITRTLSHSYTRYLTLGGLLLLSFYLLAAALEDSAHFNRLYLMVLGINLIALLLLLSFICAHLIRLVREHREHQPGSRLTLRVVAMFISLTFIPLAIVFSFSLQ